jgi:hypothetical protein
MDNVQNSGSNINIKSLFIFYLFLNYLFIIYMQIKLRRNCS